MDAMTLLAEARAAGLTVEVVSEELRVRGPRSAAAVVERLKSHKAEIVQVLRPRVLGKAGRPVPTAVVWVSPPPAWLAIDLRPARYLRSLPPACSA
jgi:hypothetical protein